MRDALATDVLAELERDLRAARAALHRSNETMRAAAAPSAPAWQQRWEQAVAALGLPLYTMPSGAGHDAMKLHEIMPQAMLFVRGLNAGISHNPLEAITNDDAELAVRAFQHLLDQLATGASTRSTQTTHDASTPGSTRTSTSRCASCRSWCACPPTRRRATTRRTPSARPQLLQAFGFAAEKHAVPDGDGARRRHASRSPT